jgi:hypothetical protein
MRCIALPRRLDGVGLAQSLKRRLIVRALSLCAPGLALTLALAGCNDEWIQERARLKEANTTPPISYRADIVAFMRTYLNDPIGVRDAFVSQPSLRSFEDFDRYTVCLRYNARKSNGQYAGNKDTLVLFRDGRLDRVVDNGREACKDAVYQPFPELQRMQR